ncbi:MAG: UbiD family decarboxylase, partial [Deltaproteobacteria bacterium]|nr:UbiD family decarboxylase [Deltaproteobacteria bacterium]
MFNDLRGFLAELEKRGELVRVRERIDDGHEVFSILWELSYREKSPVVILERVKDYDIPILGNVFGKMNRFAMAARFPEDKSYKFYRDLFMDRLTNKGRWLKPVIVETGPVKEIIVKGGDVDLYDLPVMQWHENDGGPYITWPVEVTHMEKYGTNLGTYRMMIHDKQSTGLMCNLFQDIGVHLKKAKSLGLSSMPCSVVIG